MKILYCDETSLVSLICAIITIVMLFVIMGYILFTAMSSVMAKVLSVVFIVIVAVWISIITWQASFPKSYHVVLADDYSYEELVSKYVIESQKGDIYVIHEKNGINIMDDIVDDFLFEDDEE